jgi:hypothetical protein
MILLIYPKYVGGKFIANCLALSKDCVVQDQQIAHLDLKQNPSNANYYDFKLKSVLKTLPKFENMSDWGNYEYGCEDLYGINEDFYKENSIANIRDRIEQIDIIKVLTNNNKESCLIAHDYRTALKYLLVYPDAKIIEFKNFDQFRANATRAKSGTIDKDYELARQYHYQDQEFFKLDSFMIDVDNTFYDWYMFSAMTARMYQYLGFEDFKSGLVHKFWSSYIELHNWVDKENVDHN